MSTLTARTSDILSHDRQKVLRNTYALLALTMVPTVAGAWFGMTSGIGAMLTAGWMGPVLALVVMMGFIFAIQANRNSPAGVYLLLAFTGLMGVLLSSTLGIVMGRQNGAELVMTAFAATGAAFGSMAVLSTLVRRSLAGMGTFLFAGVIVLLVAGIANMFLQSGPVALALSSLGAIVFTLFLLFDLKAVRDGYETSYVSATLNVYLSLFNLFTSLLRLLSMLSGED